MSPAGLALVLAASGCSEFRLRGQDTPPASVPGAEDSASDTAPEPIDSTCPTEPKPSRGTTIDEDCDHLPDTGPLDLSMRWSRASWDVEPSAKFCSVPSVAPMLDSDGDGLVTGADHRNLVVFCQSWSPYDGLKTRSVVRVLDARDGASKTAILGPAMFHAVGDLDGDGQPEVVNVISRDGESQSIDAFSPVTGAAIWTSELLVHAGAIAGSRPAIADLDGDGDAEILVGPAILDSTGAFLGYGTSLPPLGEGWGRPFLRSSAASFAVDLDGDGLQEIIAGNVIRNGDGEDLATAEAVDGFPGVADLDGDLVPELVTTGNDYVRVFDDALQLLWSQRLPRTEGSGAYGEPPVIADFDGDLLPEIAVASYRGITVFDGDGSTLWDLELAADAPMPPVAYDFEGDGVAEIVLVHGLYTYVLSGWDGSIRWKQQRSTFEGHYGAALVADLDEDGSGELILSYFDPEGAYTGVAVYGTSGVPFAAATSIWNQHAFTVSNVATDAGIPPSPEAPWLSTNTFRSANTEPSAGLRAPDLKPVLGGACQNECDSGILRAWVHVCNGGLAAAVGPTTLQAFALDGAGEHPLVDLAVHVDLDVGDCTVGYPIDVPADAARSARRIVFRLSHALTDDCQRANEEVWLEGPLCP